MNKKIFAIGIVLLIILFSILLIYKKPNSLSKTTKIKITASFYPLYDFAKNIGLDKVEVINITPSGAEPHDFEPTALDITKILNSDMFIFNINDSYFQPWVNKIIPDLQKNNVKLIDSSQGVDLIKGDPHFWLDPLSAIIQVENITKVLIGIDPQNANFYRLNSQNYIQKLNELDKKIMSKIKNCKQKQIITSHSIFAYLAKRYNINAISISGLSPDEEPSPARLAELVNIAKDNQIKYIFFETLVSPKLSETLAKEIGARTLVFNPLEGLTDADLLESKDYLSVQSENLNNLITALECQ